MRILFGGGGFLGESCFGSLLTERKPVLLLCRPNKAQGRGLKITPSALVEQARLFHIPFFQPEHLRTAQRRIIQSFTPDLLVSAGYGRIFGPKFLSLFPKGGINIHPSLLPRHRGSSPLHACIMAGDLQTAISVQTLSVEMDAGDIILQKSFPLSGKEYRKDLEELVSQEGPRLLMHAINLIEQGKEKRTPQSKDGVSYCSLIRKDDAYLSWKENSQQIERMVRAYSPWPGVWSLLRGKRVRFSAAHCISQKLGHGDFSSDPGRIKSFDPQHGLIISTTSDLLAVERLQYSGRKELSSRDFLNGAPWLVGEKFTALHRTT